MRITGLGHAMSRGGGRTWSRIQEELVETALCVVGDNVWRNSEGNKGFREQWHMFKSDDREV